MAGSKKIRLDRVLYVKYQHPNLASSGRFLVDFGFIPAKESEERIYYRGFGKDQYLYICEKSPTDRRHFAGGAWAVQSVEDLEAASRLPGASAIHELDAPGAGSAVTVPDPVGGILTLVHGQEERQELDKPKPVVWNSWDHKPRKGEFQRPDLGPSKVHKLGHYGFEVNTRDFQKVLQWYLDTFNLAPTDSLYKPETGEDVMTFIHVDKGEEFVDHHSMFIAAGSVEKGYRAHHSSFEVDDVDSELVGHDWLQKNGWTSCWGVGRHLLGSQIFDYWFDSSGFVLEHYSDGDLVNCRHKPTWEIAAPDSISVWGPNVPLAFLTRKMEDIVQSGPPPPIEV